MSLAENIKKYRMQKNLTQEQLASILHISSQAVSKWECNENCPDSSMLVPLANALNVSLDRLFDNKNVTFEDVALSLNSIIKKEKEESKFELIRSLCWQMEKGLFGLDIDELELDKEINTKSNSFILMDNGFTNISNRKSPFFVVFSEIENGWSETIQDGEKIRTIFECLGDKDTMQAVLFIHKNEYQYTFEADLLCTKCGIKKANLEKVIANLKKLDLLGEYKTTIDNTEYTLYTTDPSHRIISLLILADDVYYRSGYSLQMHNRRKAFLKDNQS